ncbi:MAG: hypothetical protein AB1634_05025 [Thermodesulfobacteriota bacterium]
MDELGKRQTVTIGLGLLVLGAVAPAGALAADAVCKPQHWICAVSGPSGSTVECPLNVVAAEEAAPRAAGLEQVLKWDPGKATLAGFTEEYCYEGSCYDIPVPDCSGSSPDCTWQPLLYAGHTIATAPMNLANWNGAGGMILFNMGNPATPLTDAWLDGSGAVQGDHPAYLTARFTLGTDIPAQAPMHVWLSDLTVDNNANPVAFQVRDLPGGRGVVTMAGPSAPAPDLFLAPAATTLPFPDTFTEGASPPVIITLANTGDADLVVAPFEVAGDWQQFTVDVEAGNSPCGSRNPTLAPCEVCTFGVAFAPGQAGEANMTLTIPSNDPDQPAPVLSFTGNGIGIPRPDVKANGEDTYIVVDKTQTVTVTVELTSWGNTLPADWWMILGSRSFTASCDLAGEAPAWQLGVAPALQGPIADLAPLEIFKGRLRPGIYAFQFGVDLDMNGLPGPPLFGDVVYVVVTKQPL